MKDYKVRDFMTPVAELNTVSLDADLNEAASQLRQARMIRTLDEFGHRVLLVTDDTGRGVGMLSIMDIVRSLEPKYAQIDDDSYSRFGLTKENLERIFRQYGLWEHDLVGVCTRAAEYKVGDAMSQARESEIVRENESLSFAVHQFALGGHHNLLVKNEQGEITGLLRLVNVYRKVGELLTSCPIES